MKVVKGASGEACGDLSAFGEAHLSIATSGARRAAVDRMTGFRQVCIRTWRPRHLCESTAETLEKSGTEGKPPILRRVEVSERPVCRHISVRRRESCKRQSRILDSCGCL